MDLPDGRRGSGYRAGLGAPPVKSSREGEAGVPGAPVCSVRWI